jgi:hypothetical protein
MYIKIKIAQKKLSPNFIEIHLVGLELPYVDRQKITSISQIHFMQGVNKNWNDLFLTELAVWSPVCRTGTLEASFCVTAAS